MCLLEMKIGESCVIDAIHVKGDLKRRLNSLGLMRHASVSVKTYGWFKSTVQIVINRSSIALRKEEAAQILVHKV